MKNIAIRRLHLIPAPQGGGVSAKQKLVVLSELAQLGVRVANPEILDETSEAFFLDYSALLQTIAALRGGDVEYVPLFVGFPEGIPDDDVYFAKRVMGYLGNVFEIFKDGEVLESGVRVPEWLFELRQFGADPITQMQSKSLWERAKGLVQARKDDRHTEWLDFELVRADEIAGRLREWLKRCVYAKSSIKESLHADIRELLHYFGADALDFEHIVMKENQALVLRLLWEDGREEEAVKLTKTATDILRLFAALTATDVSLATPVKFPKLSRRQRRIVLSGLDAASSLADDLQRYRGLWLELGRYIHPGEYRRQYPRAAAAFDALRNGTITTYNARTEALLRGDDVVATLRHLAQRPGVLGRKLHELLRRFPGREGVIIDAFATMAGSMSAKNLLVLKSYFSTINDDDVRTVINKRGKIKVLPNNAKDALSEDTLTSLDEVLAQALTAALSDRDSWAGKKVWIDPQLETYTVPLAQRAASDGLVSVGRGTRIPVELDKVLRLFVYWKQSSARTDLDLSVIQFDADFQYLGHVSYTNLSDSGIAHSGDIQSAPHGAAEFIDITLDKIAPNVRYLATQVYRYAGEAFADMCCHSGWMLRSDVNADYKTFDIKTVANKFDLNGRGAYCVPLVVDLKQREMIMTDLYMGTKAFHNNVEGAYGDVALAAREIARFTATRPTMQLLAEAHCRARGGDLCADPSAEITFGLRGCTYNATDVETVLSELL
ncbi:MAG: TerD family protein [Haliangiales bacterium]